MSLWRGGDDQSLQDAVVQTGWEGELCRGKREEKTQQDSLHRCSKPMHQSITPIFQRSLSCISLRDRDWISPLIFFVEFVGNAGLVVYVDRFG